jgi:hypothetical protein
MSRQHWSHKRVVVMSLSVVVWLATGLGAYLYLGSHRTTHGLAPKRPSQAKVQAKNSPLSRLPGTLYLVQDGTLYRLRRGSFTAVLSSPGGAAGWTQPAFTPDGQSLVLVRRDYAYSDLYLIDSAGNVQAQLTHNANPTVELNHWAFYPRPSSDGAVFFSYDPKDRFNYYNVVFAVWSMPMTGGIDQAQQWTLPEQFTGGDVQPVPLPSGAVLYTKYAFDQQLGKILGQVYLTTSAGTFGEALTPHEDDCAQPALSPDGHLLAMICTGGKQFANIEIAQFDGTKLGSRQVLVAGQLAAQPTWAPDGNSIVYFAPQGVNGHFQLWQQQLRAEPGSPTATQTPPPTSPATPSQGGTGGTSTPTPGAVLPPPVRLTSDLDFDATSTIAWRG